MPPRDPKDRPALDRALPADSPGRDPGYRSDNSPWEFVFGDGEWHPVTVIAWWTDRHRRQVVQVEWHAEGSTWEESFVANPERMRER